MKKTIKEICKQEGNKHQASVSDVREILKILVHLLIVEESSVYRDEWVDYATKIVDKARKNKSKKK